VCVDNFDQLHFRDTGPVQPAVGLSGRFFMIADQDEAIGVLGVHGDLLVSVRGQLVDARLGHFRELLESCRVSDVLQPQADSATVVGSVVPDKLSFGVQHFRQLAVSEGQFHKR
jgi:hypothetical protein